MLASAQYQPQRDFGPLVALVVDDPIMGQSLVDWLAVGGYRVEWLRTGQDALKRIPHLGADILVFDIRLPDMSGEEIFRSLGSSLSGVPALFITGYGDVEQAVRLMKAGAADYVIKPFEIEPFLERVATLLAPRWKQTDGAVLGDSKSIFKVEGLLRRVADIDSTVLLTGPSGSGKEVAARFLHQIGSRQDQPFVAVNCAAIPRELLESEMFGHERGSFTGAHSRHMGYVERAEAGILFLDEVTELPLSIQSKLLRLLQERTFSRVGGTLTLKSNARIVAATNADIQSLVEVGKFRDDLFFRLSVIEVAIPPLTDRRDDIVPLALRFIGEFSERFGRDVKGLTTAAQSEVLSYDFPGNIRELRNRVERAVALSESPWLGVADLFPDRTGPDHEEGSVITLAQARDDAERRRIKSVLTQTSGNVDAAAELLAVSRSTLFEKIKKLGIRS